MKQILAITTLGLALIGAGLAPSAEAANRRIVVADGQGNAATAGAGAVSGPNGGAAARAGVTRRSADGSLQHRSGFAAQGAKGSVDSSGSASKTADGQVTQNRTTSATSATSATSGNTATTTGSYNNATGRSRTTTCYDAAGATIACPTRP